MQKIRFSSLDFNDLKAGFIDYLKTKFDVIDARYYKYANMKHYPTLLLSQDTFYNDTMDVD